MMEKGISTKLVVILDCCHSGSGKATRRDEVDAAKLGRTIIDEKSKNCLKDKENIFYLQVKLCKKHMRYQREDTDIHLLFTSRIETSLALTSFSAS
jgi:hypothetical protein